MRTTVDDERDSNAVFELAAGCVAVVGAAFAAAAFGPADPIGRAVIMAVAASLLAALLRDWRACAGLVVIAALVYVGFLSHQAGQLSGDPAPWPYTLIIGFAALLGRGHRWIRVGQHNVTSTPMIGPRMPARRDDRRPAVTRPFSVEH